MPISAEAFDRYISEQLETVAKLAKAANIKIN